MNQLIDEYINRLPLDQQEIVVFLRREILNLHPAITEKLAYGLPFFTLKRPLCYINSKKNGVDICFYFGKELVSSSAFLDFTARKQVGGIFIQKMDDPTWRKVHQTLVEAVSRNLSR